jgi:hypothetical protein
MSTPATKSGYLTCSIRVGGKKATTTVQRLVLLAFVGPPPTDLHEANHKNGRKDDNRVENLEWVTRLENMRHAWDTGLMKKRGPANAGAQTDRQSCPTPGQVRHRITVETAGHAVVIEAREPTCAARSDQMAVAVDGVQCSELMGITALLALVGKQLPRQPSRKAVREAEIADTWGAKVTAP